MSDPCTLKINNVVFGFTSTDVLFHLGAEEISLCVDFVYLKPKLHMRFNLK